MRRLAAFVRTVAWAAAAIVLLDPLLTGSTAWADAGTSDWVRAEESEVRLVSAVSAAGNLAVFDVGLQIKLQPGWKTYWRSPGDAGFPVSVDWAGSTNLASADMSWPAPHRFSVYHLDTFGYSNEVVFPIAIRPQHPGEPVALRAAVDYLACNEICIPLKALLALDLPAGAASPTEFGQLINRFAVQVPGNGAAQGLALETVGLAGSDRVPILEVVARSSVPFEKPDVTIEGPAEFHFGAPDVTLTERKTVATLRVPVTVYDAAAALPGARLTLTLVDGTRGLEQAVEPQRLLHPTDVAPAPLASMLLLALLGGLILNLMPCVLPVLSLKLLSVVDHGGGSRRSVRASFLASAAGVLAAFLGLAAIVASLKAAGVVVGWGIQFQQPMFLIAMVLLVTLFACNLWGLFSVELPAWLGGMAVGAIHKAGRYGKLTEHFLTGAFATLLATPCSAPFLGTAVGFALARGTGEILSVFIALGLGLSLPYLIVAAVPSLATRLPRPGKWMIWLRYVLGFALAATAFWLLTVLSRQIDTPGALVVGLLMLAVVGTLWTGRWLVKELRFIRPALVGALALAAFLAPSQIPSREITGPAVTATEGLWRPFDEARIPTLLRVRKIVFVDVTADWCITCQVNKRLVLDIGEVAKDLTADDVVAMKADWTRPNDDIARYLASFGRYGIPFNVIYGPGAPNGVVLPELLTESAVLDAFAKARGEAPTPIAQTSQAAPAGP